MFKSSWLTKELIGPFIDLLPILPSTKKIIIIYSYSFFFSLKKQLFDFKDHSFKFELIEGDFEFQSKVIHPFVIRAFLQVIDKHFLEKFYF